MHGRGRFTRAGWLDLCRTRGEAYDSDPDETDCAHPHGRESGAIGAFGQARWGEMAVWPPSAARLEIGPGCGDSLKEAV